MQSKPHDQKCATGVGDPWGDEVIGLFLLFDYLTYQFNVNNAKVSSSGTKIAVHVTILLNLSVGKPF